jgi:Zn-dependent metalloprotease
MRFFFPLLLCLFSFGLMAQTGDNSVTTYPPNTPFKNLDLIKGSARFNLDADHELRKHYELSGAGNRLHLKYHQYYKNLRVTGGTVVYHLQNTKLYATTGRLSQLEGLDVTPRMSIKQGERLARLRAGAELLRGNGGGFIPPGKLKLSGTDLVVTNQRFPQRGGDHFPAYVYNFTADDGQGLPVDLDVIVNARNGRVITAISNIHTDAATGTGNGFYHQNISFPVDSVAPDHYELYDESRGQGVFAFDVSNFLGTPTDEDNDWTADREGQAAMLDGYHASVKFHDFLMARFNRNSIDNEGHPLVANMNRHSLVNAFWNGSEATFGNGDCDRYSPLTTFEIVAHEFAHGLTDFTSDLIYRDESGALNESISDIMGKGFEWYYDNDNFNWKIGSTIRRNPNERFFRSLEDPGERNHPKLYKGENWRGNTGTSSGVHTNSSVFNFWFYLLVEGKESTNEVGVAYDVKPIGMDSALQLVYLLESAYLTESSGYRECYEFSLPAAADLFGEGSAPYLSVLEAWKAVGMPYASDPNEPVTIAVEANYLSNGTFDTELCPEELADMRGIYRNNSDSTILAGTTVGGRVIYYYSLDGTETRDTVAITEQVIDEDISPGEQFTVQLSYALTSTPRIVNTTNELTFRGPGGEMYTARDNDFIFINGISIAEIEFTYNAVSERCDSPELLEEYITVALPRCAGTTTGTIRFTYANATDALTYDFELTDFERPAQTFYNTFEDVDFASLGSPNGITLRVVFIQGGEETLLLEDDYASYFAEEISVPTLHDFSDVRGTQVELGITVCDNCEASYADEQLTISNASEAGELPTCIPLDEYLRSQLGRRNNISNISLCVDVTAIEDPHFVFSIRQEDVEGQNAVNNGFLHLADVYAGTTALLDEPISTTGGATKNVEIPLPAGYVGDLNLYFLTTETSTTLDNIGITSGAPSPTRRLTAGNFAFTYANPVSDRLELRAKVPVPVNTRVSLIAADGRLVTSQTMRFREADIDLSNQPAGLYFLSVTDGNSFRWTGKLVKL